MADAADLGVSSELREEAVRAVTQTQERLLQADAESVDWAEFQNEERTPPSTPDENTDRSRSPSRWVPSTITERYSPSRDLSPGSSSRVGGPELPSDFLAAMQNMLWPVEFQERDRPADLLSFESALNPTVRMAPLRATDEVVALILALRQVGLDYRAQQPHAHKSHDGPFDERRGRRCDGMLEGQISPAEVDPTTGG